MFRYRRLYLVCGLLMAASEIWKQLTLTLLVGEGSYIWWYFPFQLCSVPMYLCLLLPWVRSERLRRALLTFLMDFGLLSGSFTFFDTSGLQYSYAPLTVHSYLWHLLLIALGLFTGLTQTQLRRWRSFPGAGILFLCGCGLATVFNLALHPLGKINMFYISPHYIMGQVVYKDIAQAIGNNAGICFYILTILLGGAIFHGLWCALSRLCEKRR